METWGIGRQTRANGTAFSTQGCFEQLLQVRTYRSFSENVNNCDLSSF